MTCDKNKEKACWSTKKVWIAYQTSMMQINQSTSKIEGKQTIQLGRGSLQPDKKETQCMTCDKNNKKETLRRTQGLRINQTTMMEMTSNEHKRNGNKQVLQEKNV